MNEAARLRITPLRSFRLRKSRRYATPNGHGSLDSVRCAVAKNNAGSPPGTGVAWLNGSSTFNHFGLEHVTFMMKMNSKMMFKHFKAGMMAREALLGRGRWLFISSWKKDF